jgi:hypothetical protein
MRQNFIKDLLSKGFTQNENGVSVYDMEYEELKHELKLAMFREADVDNDQNKWF